MAIDPLSLTEQPQSAPASQPGFFDGQMAATDPAELPGLDPVENSGLAVPAEEQDTPTVPEVQVAGVGGKVLKRLFGGGEATKPGVNRLFPGDELTGTAGNYTVIREATQEEVDEFSSLTGKTSGAPSPTNAQRAAGVPTAQFNLENINGPDDLKATIDNVAEMWKSAGEAAGRGKMTFDEIKSLANDMGLEDTVERLLRRPTGTTMNAEQITASLQAIATSGMELNRLAKIAANSTDSADLLRFRQHMAFHSALQTNMKGAQAEAGRALAAFRIPRGVGPDIDAQSLQNLMTEFGGENSVRDMAKSFVALPTQAQRNKFSYGAWDKIKGSWFEVWINGLLSSPATHIVNMTGNTMFQMFTGVERLGAGLIGGARQLMGSKSERVFLTESLADAMGVVQGIGDGFRLARDG